MSDVDREAMREILSERPGDPYYLPGFLIGNRDAVLRAYGLHEERDASDTLHRFVSDWEDVTDE